jgi:hypothetical protein
VALVQRNHEIRTLTVNRADQAFAKLVRLRRPHRCLEDRQPHRRNSAIDSLGMNAVVVVDDKSMRLIARHDHSELLGVHSDDRGADYADAACQGGWRIAKFLSISGFAMHTVRHG